MVVFLCIIAVDKKIICGYNFVALEYVIASRRN